MIREILIENFKSIPSLKMELGRFNVLIGANGCGKSNILEAIAMGCAAAEDKLDNASLINRGLRLTEPKLMKSGFKEADSNAQVKIQFTNDKGIFNYVLENDNQPFTEWRNLTDKFINQLIDKAIIDNESVAKELVVKKLNNNKLDASIIDTSEFAEMYKASMEKVRLQIHETLGTQTNTIRISRETDFSIYSPENYFLRRFEDEDKGKVLGLRGEGLFQMLQVISSNNLKKFDEIKQHLSVFDWFENAEIPSDLMSTEKRLRITDAYLQDGLKYFDQKSANEGFLYLLFYLTLFISEYTPKFFAIDNIDNALNPKLGAELMQILAKLAKKYNKQVIFTTHNPAILDGLDLSGGEQRLFVISRNKSGHTKALRVPDKERNTRLSESFIRGYIGGLPKNF